MTELANCHFYIGDYAESDSLNRRVLEMDRKLYGERHPHVADDLINLGANQYEWGHYPQAEQFYRQALGIIQVWYGRANPETASAMTMVGRALFAEQKFAEARAMAGEALYIQEQVYGPVHPRVASALNEVGKVALQQGKFEEAEASFRRMEDIYRSVYSDKHYLIGVAEANRGGVYMEKKNTLAPRNSIATHCACMRRPCRPTTRTWPSTGQSWAGLCCARGATTKRNRKLWLATKFWSRNRMPPTPG